jgi:hypothetical protein
MWCDGVNDCKVFCAPESTNFNDHETLYFLSGLQEMLLILCALFALCIYFFNDAYQNEFVCVNNLLVTNFFKYCMLCKNSSRFVQIIFFVFILFKYCMLKY